MRHVFNIYDIEPGYVVKTRDGDLYQVIPTANGVKCLVDPDTLNPPISFSRYDFNLRVKGCTDYYRDYESVWDIVAVYGFVEKPMYATMSLEQSLEHRKLLWTGNGCILPEDEAKEMTLDEIEKALGHKVKVVTG